MGLRVPRDRHFEATLRLLLWPRSQAQAGQRRASGRRQASVRFKDRNALVARGVQTAHHQLEDLFHRSRTSFLPKSHGEIRFVFKQVGFRTVVGEHPRNHLVPNTHSSRIDIAVIAHHLN